MIPEELKYLFSAGLNAERTKGKQQTVSVNHLEFSGTALGTRGMGVSAYRSRQQATASESRAQSTGRSRDYCLPFGVRVGIMASSVLDMAGVVLAANI
jgi:hypothetical protein